MDNNHAAVGKFGFPVLRLKSEFDAVKQKGIAVKTAVFIFLYLPDGTLSTVHCGIICSRRFHIRAVRRNRAKRLLREALRTGIPAEVQPGRILLIPRRLILKKNMPEVREMLLEAMKKTGVILSGRSPEQQFC